MDMPHRRLPNAVAWLAAWCGICGAVARPTAADEPIRRIDLIRDVPTAGDLAAPANGQTLYVLEEASGSVVAIDPFEPTKRWIAVAAAEQGAAEPTAIGAIDTGTLVMLCRGRTGWSMQSHRVQPGVTAKPGAPAQTVAIGGGPAADVPGDKAAATRFGVRPTVAVSPSRDWLTVVGIPSPAAPVLRAPIAGARIGAISARSCPPLAAAVQPATITISTADEFVIFARDPSAGAAAGTFVSFYLPQNPRRLLHIDTGLSRIHDAAFCRADGTLWVVGGDPGSATSPEGLWRIDAVLRQGRQEARAVCVARLDGAVSLACLSERAIIVTHGRTARMVSRIDPKRDVSDDNASPRSERPAEATP